MKTIAATLYEPIRIHLEENMNLCNFLLEILNKKELDLQLVQLLDGDFIKIFMFVFQNSLELTDYAHTIQIDSITVNSEV